MNDDELQFLKESNAIEGVYDDDSLNQAIYAWEFLKEEPILTVGVVLKTHKILMLHQPIPGYLRGYFRNCDVSVGGQIKLKVDQIKPAMHSWVKDVATTLRVPGKNGEHIKIDHVAYENIHPFIDGNGRTGRMFMNWQRLKQDLPILVIKEDEKFDYYKWFRE